MDVYLYHVISPRTCRPRQTVNQVKREDYIYTLLHWKHAPLTERPLRTSNLYFSSRNVREEHLCLEQILPVLSNYREQLVYRAAVSG